METINPQGVANFDPRGMIDTIYHGDYQTLLQFTKSRTELTEALGFVVSEKKIFLVFPIVSYGRLTPPGRSQFGPQGRGWHDL